MDKRLPHEHNDALEALELTKRFADETGINVVDSRPCVATLYFEGVAGGGCGRKPGAFIVALELSVAGVPVDTISTHLEAFGGRCSPPLGKNVLAGVLRSIKTGQYDKRQGCEKLQAYCIGRTLCPSVTKGGASLSKRQQSGSTAFRSLGWMGYIKGSMTNVYLALMDLRIKRGLDPDALFIFDFSELELRSGVSRGSLRKNLEKLKKIGLIDKLTIGSEWGSDTRHQTEVRLASPVPNPTQLGLVPLRSKEKDF